MRGKTDRQAVLFVAAIDLEARVRPDHPLRAVKRMADQDLAKMSRQFDAAYAREGRPSVPPERLIKAMLLQALYSIRSEAQLLERIDHDLLFRWFLDLRIDDEVFDATVFSHNRGRLGAHDLIARFFEHTVRRAMDQGLVSPDHFSVDGSLIEAYASIKSFKPKDGSGDGDNNGFKSRNAEVGFHGQTRSNATHASRTDPDAKLVRKSDGKPALLSHARCTRWSRTAMGWCWRWRSTARWTTASRPRRCLYWIGSSDALGSSRGRWGPTRDTTRARCCWNWRSARSPRTWR